MKVSWSDLTPDEQMDYGNGCGLDARLLNVPDFIYTASCRQHDFNFERGSGAWYKAPYYYTKANWDFFTHMLADAKASDRPITYSIISVVYFLGVMVFSWPVFSWGRWRTKEEILSRDRASKGRVV